MAVHSCADGEAYSWYLYVISAAQPHMEKGATPISLPEANGSTLGAVACIPAHNNDTLSLHDDALLDKESAAESVLITVESDLTVTWMMLVLMMLCVYYHLRLIKLGHISNAPITRASTPAPKQRQ